MMNTFVRVLVSILSWLSFFALVWGTLLGRLPGWQSAGAAMLFFVIGLVTMMEPATKEKRP